MQIRKNIDYHNVVLNLNKTSILNCYTLYAIQKIMVLMYKDRHMNNLTYEDENILIRYNKVLVGKQIHIKIFSEKNKNIDVNLEH